MNAARPGPVDPPAPEGLIVMTVRLATAKVRKAMGFTAKSQHEWHVPAHFMVFAAETSSSGDYLDVCIDMAGWTPSCRARFVGVTVDTAILSSDSDLFTVAVAGAVTVAASCEDLEPNSLTYSTPGNTVWWTNKLDAVGFSSAPDGFKTLSLIGLPAQTPTLTHDQLISIDPLYAKVHNMDDETAIKYGEEETTVGVLKTTNRLWASCQRSGGAIGMLLAKGSFVQHEIRVLLAAS